MNLSVLYHLRKGFIMRRIYIVGIIAVAVAIGIFYYNDQQLLEQLPDDFGSASTGATLQKKVKKETNMNPDLTIDENGLSKATVTIETQRGKIKFQFYSEDAPNTTKRIIELINDGFYDGLTFHRVVPGFVVQGGDPAGNGTGGSGQNLNAEFNKRRHVDGTLAMARAQDPNSADSQFYISLGVHPHLDNSYTVFGQVIEGISVAHEIQVGDKMDRIYIE